MKTRFDRFATILNSHLDGFEVKYKDESTLMKIIAFILFFNRSFMTGFITTIGRKVYWPSREGLEARSDMGSITTLAHEYQHAKDAQNRTAFLFGLLYLVPQILALPGALMLLAAPVWIPLMVMGTIAWSWWLLIPLLTLLFIAPLPAPWRMHYEVKGYTMSLFCMNEFLTEAKVKKEQRIEYLMKAAQSKNQNFTGPNYYFMWPFGVEDRFNRAVGEIISGEIYDRDPIYSEIAQAIKDSK